MKYKVKILIQTNMGTNTDTKLIEISPYMHQIGHSLNSREITRNVQEGSRIIVCARVSHNHLTIVQSDEGWIKLEQLP